MSDVARSAKPDIKRAVSSDSQNILRERAELTTFITQRHVMQKTAADDFGLVFFQLCMMFAQAVNICKFGSQCWHTGDAEKFRVSFTAVM